jgi:hypothetical protein
MSEHVAQLGEVLDDPDAQRAEIERFLVSFVRPHGLGQPATPLLADAIEALGALPHRRRLTTRLAFSGARLERYAVWRRSPVFPRRSAR